MNTYSNYLLSERVCIHVKVSSLVCAAFFRHLVSADPDAHLRQVEFKRSRCQRRELLLQ